MQELDESNIILCILYITIAINAIYTQMFLHPPLKSCIDVTKIQDTVSRCQLSRIARDSPGKIC